MSHETTYSAGRSDPLAGERRPARRWARQLLIGLLLVAVMAVLGGVAAKLWAARRFRRELAEARQEMAAGLLSLARKRLSRLAEERPDQAEVAYQLGRCEAARGKTDAALKLWARIPPGSRWAAPAAVEFAQAAIPSLRLAEAERVLRSALRSASPELPALRHLLLILLGQEGRIAEARGLIESLSRDTAILPANDLADRLVMLREHVGLDLESFPLEWNLRQLEEGTQTAGDDDRPILALARAHLATHSGEFERARAELESCLERRPGDPALWKSWLDWAVAAGRPGPAREALDHLPDDLLDDAEVLDLRAWFARQRHDARAERAALEQLVEREPGRIPALTRLAELLQQAGEVEAAAVLRRRKDEIDAALDRYSRLYRENRFADHVPELASLAERLGRRFEARVFWEIVAIGEPKNPDARPALARLATVAAARSATSGSHPKALAFELDRVSPLRQRAAGETGGLISMPRFEDRSSAQGLAGFVQDNGVSPIHQLPEMSSGGVGLLDFDGDGFLDVYCVQGGRFPPDPGVSFSGDRLYRNRGDGTFEDVTTKTGIGAMPRGYGHGVAVSDYDNDGHPDVFVTRWRSYALYRNRGDGTFEDVTQKAGLGGQRDWPTSAAFADLDNDGDLDLYVCHYGVWDTRNPRVCKDPSGTIVLTCDPRGIESLPDHVFRNDTGRFVDVTAEAGIIDRDGRGLGVVAADLDGDGRIDLFVANDSTANFLYRNLGGFRFEEVGHAAGVAANAAGGYQAGMGVACGDLDGDGLVDLAVTNYYGESTTLFHNLGGGLFADHTAAAGLAAPSRLRLGFGAAFLDANNDGWLDLLTANGHVSDNGPLFPYAMTPQLYLGSASGTLTDVTARAGPPFQQLHVGRGLAIGDLDNDGRIDALMVAQNEPLVDLHNETDSGNADTLAGRGESQVRSHFIMFQLEGTKSNRDGIGAVASITCGGRARVALRFGGGSFQSAGDPRLHLGLGSKDQVESVELHWPSGLVDRHRDLAADRVYLLREGNSSPRVLRAVRP
ncbi:MAG: FG-GAP-like repeat-containing protein [Isosphaerales bacterium]